jgi:thiamine pyrophosphate-dependent acetolactate synthase large subunit-like protein
MNVLEVVDGTLACVPDALVVASLGTATAALRDVTRGGPHLYMGGAMGATVPVALGVAEQLPHMSVVAIVGDGDLLMGARSLWTVSGVHPGNLLIVVLADGHYHITGGQRIEATATFADAGSALPGLSARRVGDLDGLATAITELPRPALVEVEVDERVTPEASPFVDCQEVRLRFAAAAQASS